jgi:hypothetical protein
MDPDPVDPKHVDPDPQHKVASHSIIMFLKKNTYNIGQQKGSSNRKKGK